MDRQSFVKKFLGSKSKKGIVLSFGTVMLLTALFLIGPVRKQLFFLTQGSAKNFKIPSFLETYADAWKSLNQKMDDLRVADNENERLRMENAHLRIKLETMQFECKGKDLASFTKDLGSKLKTATGSPVGRVLATLGYSPPTHLTQTQLFALGTSYFKAREDEKSAVIFTILADMDGINPFRNPRTNLLAGASWYRLDNFEMANQYLDKVLEFPDATENLPFQAQARLWKALSAARVSKQADAQQWLRDLVDHHPHSMEAGWVNSKEATRATASED